MSYTLASGSLFGNDNTFSYTDIHQGDLGDCYFLSSLGAIAEEDQSAIRNMFHDNGDGTFTVKLFGENNGVITNTDYVTVDKWLPTNIRDKSGNTGQIFARYDNGNIGLWVALAEKAYAEFSELGLSQRPTHINSYGSIENGFGYLAMPSISGNQSLNFDPNTQQSNFLAIINTDLKNGKAVTADTQTTTNDQTPIDAKQLNLPSIYGSHEYMIISVNSNTLTLLNPWNITDRSGGNIITLSSSDFLKYYTRINIG